MARRNGEMNGMVLSETHARVYDDSRLMLLSRFLFRAVLRNATIVPTETQQLVAHLRPTLGLTTTRRIWQC